MTASLESPGANYHLKRSARSQSPSDASASKLTRMLGRAEDEIRALRSENVELRDANDDLVEQIEAQEKHADLEALVDAMLDAIEKIGLTDGDRRDLARNGVIQCIAKIAEARGRSLVVDDELGAEDLDDGEEEEVA